MRKARKSQVSKARSALQYRLQEVAQAKSRLESATALLQEATAREVELVEAAARQKTQELQRALDTAVKNVAHYERRVDAQREEITALRRGRGLEQERFDARSARQSQAIARLSLEVEDSEKAAVKWRTAALVLLVTTVVTGCLHLL